MAKFIHAADLHLDSPFKGLHAMPEAMLKQVRRSTFDALNNLTDVAISEEIDFLLISGDIYDYEDRSIRAQAYFRDQMIKLQHHHIPVYLIHGNHDYLDAEGHYLALPPNVYTFGETPETTTLELHSGERIGITGFSYGTKWVNERKIRDYPPRHAHVDWHIGMLHGFSEGSGNGHAKYAPFHLEELRSKGYDYWALGHIHTRQKLSDSPLAYYSGNTQGRHKKESGEKGALLVHLTPLERNVSFIPTSTIQWEHIEINAVDVLDLSTLVSHVEEKINEFTIEAKNTILTVKLMVSPELDPVLLKKITTGELLRALQHQEHTKPFTWINELKIEIGAEAKKYSTIATTFEEDWKKALEDTNTESAMASILEDFFRNAPSMRMIPLNEKEYREEILKEAVQLIHTAIGNED